MKKLHRFFSFLLATALFASCLPTIPLTAKAAAQTSGYYTYTVENGEATITDCDSSISGDVMLPSTLGGYPVTTIGDDAFRFCSQVTGITIPASVKTIRTYAFCHLDNVKTITFAGSSITIESWSFCYLPALESIDFGSCEATIGEWSFSYCEKLTCVDFGAGFVYLDNNCFFDCAKLTTVLFPDCGAYVGTGVFSSSELLEYNTYDNCNYLGSANNPYVVLMKDTDYERSSLMIHQNTKAIAGSACGAYKLQAFQLPGGLITIGESAFRGCYEPTSVTIGWQVKIIGKYAFERQVEFLVAEDNANYCSDSEGVLYTEGKTTLIQAPKTLSATYTISAATKTIEPFALRYCENLTALTVEAGNTAFCADAYGVLYNKDKTELVHVPAGLSGSYIMPDTVTECPENPFYNCKNLTSITLGKGITTLPYRFFSGCDYVTRLYLHENLTYIDSQAFTDCYRLEYNTYDNGKYLGSAEKPYLVFVEAVSTDITACQIHADTKVIHSDAFYECSQLTAIDLPGSIRVIGEYAFRDCSSLEEITIPAGLIYPDNNLDYHLFSGCDSLKKIHLPQDVSYRLLSTLVYRDSLTDIYFDGTKAQWENLISSNGPAKLVFENATVHTNDGSSAPGVVASGKWGDNLSWTLNNENVMTITGTGAMSQAELPLDIQRETVKVIISEGVTSICDNAFSSWSSMREISIPSTVTVIGKNAFRTTGLESVTIPDTVTVLGDGIFEDCSWLTDVTLPAGLTAVPENSFSRCYQLTGISLPGTVTTIGSGAFSDSGLTDISLPAGVTVIEDYAFSGCRNLTQIRLPYGLTTIGRSAFSSCTKLSSAALPATLTSLGDNAFNGIAITELRIPSGITRLYMGTFGGCANLKTVYLPLSVAQIDEAFFDCDALTDVYYDGTKVQWSAINFGHHKPFPNATIHLTDDTLAPGTEMTGTIGDNIFWIVDAEGTLTLTGTGAMVGYGAGPDWYNVKKIVVKEGITTLSNGIFMGCSGATEIRLPSTLTSIGDHAFTDCTNLTSIALPANLKTIGSNAFSHTGLNSITIPSGVTTLGSDVFSHCEALTTVVIPGSVKEIPMMAFWNCTALKNVTISSGVGMIANEAFMNCSALTTISVPASVKTIDRAAFMNCTALQNVSLAEGIEWFSEGVFRNCTSLKTIVIPKSVTLLSPGVFENCYNLESITVPFLGPDAYSAVGSYQYPLGILFLGSEEEGFAKVNQHSLDRDYGIIPEEMLIPANLRSVTITVGDVPLAAFENCTMLKQIHLLGSTTRIPQYAFHGCTGLTDVYYSGTQSQWRALSVAQYNEALDSVTMHFGATSVPNGWYQRNNKWYFGRNGQNVTGWLLDGGKWYYMDGSGVMQTGWVKVGNFWYFMNKSGAMKTGWHQEGSIWYYLKPSGEMVTGEYTIGGKVNKFNGSGVWLGEVQQTAKNGWLLEGGSWYYYKNNVKATGWLQDGGSWYYFNSAGIMQTGWVSLGSQRYYMKPGGQMVTGEYTIDGVLHKFNSSGVWLGEVQQTAKNGWKLEDGKWYYYKNNIKATSWLQDGGNWYYLEQTGAMKTGWVKLSGTWYYMNQSGVMQIGWQRIDGTWYYFKTSGAMVTGTVTINGTVYHFNASGAWIS